MRHCPSLPALAGLAIPVGLLAQPSRDALPVWTIGSDPVLAIGVVEGLDAEMFVRVHDAALLPDGGVAVLDQGALELRLFDAGGDPVAVAGRRGEGELWPDGSLGIPYYGPDAARTPAAGIHRVEATLLRYVGDERQDLGSYPYIETLVGQTGGARMPFRAHSAAAAGGSPLRIYVADDSGLPVVRRYDDRGRLTQTIRLIDTREPISRSTWDSILDTLPRFGDPADAERALAAWGRPELGPAFEDLMADSDGRLWVLSRTLAGAPFAVVYERGAPVASLDLPPVDRILEVGTDCVLALDRDALGVETIRVFRYSRQ